MNPIAKISQQMLETFEPSKCHFFHSLKFVVDYSTDRNGYLTGDIEVTIVYDSENKDKDKVLLLKLLLINVRECKIICFSELFDFGRLIFYDAERNSGCHVVDELGGFHIICDDVQFIEKIPYHNWDSLKSFSKRIIDPNTGYRYYI